MASELGGEPCLCERIPARLRRVLQWPLPLNRASAEDLELLPGIGPVRAAAIVAYRERHGPFGDPADLQRVHGIGPRTAARLAGELFSGGRDPACAGESGDPAGPKKRRSTIRKLWPVERESRQPGRRPSPGG